MMLKMNQINQEVYVGGRHYRGYFELDLVLFEYRKIRARTEERPLR